ncbi:MAG: SURF1 family protein [Rhizobiaceae bacterium]|nr:SURF1 family protein [Rhizobiaceae bacterium]
MTETASGERAGSLRTVAVLVLLVSAFAVLIALGTWQVYRLQWKEGLLAQIEERTNAAPVELTDAELRFRTEGSVEYWPVTARGSFLHDAERHFFTTWKGQSGFNVYTPLILADGRAGFVNRGFVPFDRKDAALRSEGQVEGLVEISGLARDPLAAKPSFIVPDNEPDKNVFYWKDIAAMGETAGLPAGTELVPFFIDANDAPNPGGLPVGGVTLIDLPNNHLQYAVTWYGLALALVAVALFRFRPRRAARP